AIGLLNSKVLFVSVKGDTGGNLALLPAEYSCILVQRKRALPLSLKTATETTPSCIINPCTTVSIIPLSSANTAVLRLSEHIPASDSPSLINDSFISRCCLCTTVKVERINKSMVIDVSHIKSRIPMRWRDELTRPPVLIAGPPPLYEHYQVCVCRALRLFYG